MCVRECLVYCEITDQMLVAMNDANRPVVAKSMVERCIERLASLDIHACFVHWFVSSFYFNLIARLSSCLFFCVFRISSLL